MDIHKPKAAHSWREFLIEIGTIVCGIVIAICLEQGVEWLHHDGELRETREALMKEMATNVRRAAFSAREDRCLYAGVGPYQKRVSQGRSPPRTPWNGAPYTTTIWDVSQSGAVARMPVEEKFRFASFYDLVKNLQSLKAVQQTQMIHGARYFELDHLGPLDVRDAVLNASELKNLLRYKIANELVLVAAAASFGVHPVRSTSGAESMARQECAIAGIASPDFTKPLPPPPADPSQYDPMALD